MGPKNKNGFIDEKTNTKNHDAVPGGGCNVRRLRET
jgi:hypothetical protein